LFQLQKINATSVKFLSEYTKNEKGTSVDQTRKVWVILLEIKLRYKTNKQTRKKERIHGFSSQSLKDHQEKEERYS
jgi:hypothetical protein